jgi:hypothetical protein
MKTRVFHYGAVVLLFCLLSATARSQIFINVGDHTLLPNTPGQTIDISVSGGIPVQGLNFNVQVADGFPDGTPPGTVDGPNITAIDILGTASKPTIFFGNNTGQQPIRSDPQVWSASTTTSLGLVNAAGLLGILTIDTTGWFGGNWTLALNNTQEGPTDFTLLSATITDGSITVVPEPVSTSLVTSALLAGGLLFRHLRRR